MDEVLKGTDRETILRLQEQIKSYLYSDYVDDPEIVRLIDRYLLEDNSWYMILVDLATYEDVADLTSQAILYEVIKNATVRHVDPDSLKEIITTVEKLGREGNNIISIYYK